MPCWARSGSALTFNCELESGRIAYIPGKDLLYSAYITPNERGEARTVKTLTSAFTFESDPEAELEVSYVTERRKLPNGRYEYHTFWANGTKSWEASTKFMDDDGTFTNPWLEFADEEDVMDAITGLKKAHLFKICHAQGWKVYLPNFPSLSV